MKIVCFDINSFKFSPENKFEQLADCGKFIEEEEEEHQDFIASLQDVQVRKEQNRRLEKLTLLNPLFITLGCFWKFLGEEQKLELENNPFY